MANKRIKRIPTYKQMAFETAVRNPERYIDILSAVSEFEGIVLSDENLLQIVSKLYVDGIVSSTEIVVSETTNVEDIKEEVKEVNSTRRADGGFPSGYASRFWTYMRTPSELGLVYAQYNQPFKLSDICRKLILEEIDEQEAFSIQAIKYNRSSPYRNVNNDFNFFTFIINVLLELRKEGKSLSYEQFIVAMFSQNGNVAEFLNLLNNNTFKDFDEAYNFVKKEYKVNTKFKTITQDYPDVVRRVFIISGFITIRFVGKKLIQINESKLKYIQKLLKFDFKFTEEEKTEPLSYFNKLNTQNKALLSLVQSARKEDIIDGEKYVNKIFSIIDDYKINEDIILESIDKIGTKRTVIDEFKEIPEPLKLEFFISILIALKYGKKYAIRPNYKADHIGKPYSHAPGNKGDIEIFSEELYWLIEVTLIRNKTQQLNHETANVIRHLYSNEEFSDRLIKYLSFVAPVIHQDVREFFDYSIVKSRSNDYDVSLKPYDLQEFVGVTQVCENFEDMENYTKGVVEGFRNNLN
jgi:hypothetical protein